MPDPSDGRPALDDAAADVGARVRALRTERGLSLSELARRAAIGKATLSGLEAGTRNPTLDTLYAVTAALGLPLTALVAGPGPVRGAAAEMELLRVFDDAGATFELYRMHLPGGGVQRSPAHHAGVTEHVTVFSGVLEAGPDAAPHRAGPGEYVEWAADRPHTYRAVGPGDVHASLLIRYPHRTVEPAADPPRTRLGSPDAAARRHARARGHRRGARGGGVGPDEPRRAPRAGEAGGRGG